MTREIKAKRWEAGGRLGGGGGMGEGRGGKGGGGHRDVTGDADTGVVVLGG